MFVLSVCDRRKGGSHPGRHLRWIRGHVHLRPQLPLRLILCLLREYTHPSDLALHSAFETEQPAEGNKGVLHT